MYPLGIAIIGTQNKKMQRIVLQNPVGALCQQRGQSGPGLQPSAGFRVSGLGLRA